MRFFVFGVQCFCVSCFFGESSLCVCVCVFFGCFVVIFSGDFFLKFFFSLNLFIPRLPFFCCPSPSPLIFLSTPSLLPPSTPHPPPSPGLLLPVPGNPLRLAWCGVLCCAVQANAAVSEMPFPPSVIEDPPIGEGWDEHGNDLSKIANDVSHLERMGVPQMEVMENVGGRRGGEGSLFSRWHGMLRTAVIRSQFLRRVWWWQRRGRARWWWWWCGWCPHFEHLLFIPASPVVSSFPPSRVLFLHVVCVACCCMFGHDAPLFFLVFVVVPREGVEKEERGEGGGHG